MPKRCFDDDPLNSFFYQAQSDELTDRNMAETIGSLSDKITILELKRYYMARQTERQDATEQHRQECRQRLSVLTRQRDDLVEELDRLFQDVMAGRKTLKVYRQYKMYNDPKYRSSPPS
ncbi:hypothetical protein CSA56_01155 [candidate division KSB3 bacterium]|uniref:DUF4254 domain-containing protein n=1 Tax=candidate division KSB3 bacterium TaxID=2044937 RepID=A0A2G6KKL3_9BACT|nr:MAG: hypothetical protein CSA56_01155 [candidate division KSB3 bacterium]